MKTTIKLGALEYEIDIKAKNKRTGKGTKEDTQLVLGYIENMMWESADYNLENNHILISVQSKINALYLHHTLEKQGFYKI